MKTEPPHLRTDVFLCCTYNTVYNSVLVQTGAKISRRKGGACNWECLSEHVEFGVRLPPKTAFSYSVDSENNEDARPVDHRQGHTRALTLFTLCMYSMYCTGEYVCTLVGPQISRF